MSKFGCLVEAMREEKVDIMMLSDLHGHMDEAVGVDSRFNSCMIEEFVLVQCGRVGFFMSPAVVKGWDGLARCWASGGRFATIDLFFD